MAVFHPLRKLPLVLALAASLPWSNLLLAGTPQGEAPPSILDLLSHKEVVQINLYANIDSLLSLKTTETQLPATFQFTDPHGARKTHQITIKPRGKFRRRFCDFPPLKIKFSKQELQSAGLSPLNELKLVTHCVEDKQESTEQVFREYLAYRLYNLLTPVSFRVQLAKMTYIDTGNNKRKIKRWGLLIEDLEELEHRTGLSEFDTLGAPRHRFHPNYEKITSLFQYMIGNTDWNPAILHNVKTLQNQEGKLIPVPYDFDFATLVQASYARPNTNVGQKSLSQRVFMGFSTSPQELYPITSYFKSKKGNLYELIQDFSPLAEESRLQMIAYLDVFYTRIDNLDSIRENLFPPTPQTAQSP
jgi:hypothetical protein